ncbi:MAG: energy-coupling factor ABC transporter permease [Cellulosilyticaceae bacterium]
MKRKECILAVFCMCMGLMTFNLQGMHVMEGFLPPVWCISWGMLCIPFFVMGLRSAKRIIAEDAQSKLVFAMAGAFTFVLSALKIPSVTGSCSHATGMGLGAILFGPMVMVVIGVIVLVFQALLLAHGGITTLGANVFSMAVVGPVVAYCVYRLIRKTKLPESVAIFAAAMLGDLLTYVMTSVQLALAFPAQEGGIATSLVKFLGVFATTQLPLAISEGLLTVVIVNGLKKYSKQGLISLGRLSKEVANENTK